MQHRNEILLDFYTENLERNVKTENNLIHVNCEVAIIFLYEKLCIANRFICSKTGSKKCHECNHKEQYCHPFVRTKNLSLKSIQESIVSTKKKCPKCKSSNVTINETLSSVIAIQKESDSSSRMARLPNTIEVDGETYHKFAAIIQQNFHFIAHIFRANNLQEIYDDMNSSVIRETKENMVKANVKLIFYIKHNKQMTK